MEGDVWNEMYGGKYIGKTCEGGFREGGLQINDGKGWLGA